MDLPIDASMTIAEGAGPPLYFGVKLRTCGGCGQSYTAEEVGCPRCGPRAARPRWLDAPAPTQMPEGIPAIFPIVAAEVVA